MMRILILVLLLSVTAPGALGAATPADVIREIQANLDRAPWEAVMAGRVRTPDGAMEDTEFLLRVVPRPERVARMEFRKPESLEGDFIVMTPTEIWNYSYNTNQLVITPLARAQGAGQRGNLLMLGDLERLLSKVTFQIVGDEQTPAGAAWRIRGRAKDSSVGFAEIELLVLKQGPTPVSVRLTDAAGKLQVDLGFRSFRRSTLTAEILKAYPPDALVIRR